MSIFGRRIRVSVVGGLSAVVIAVFPAYASTAAAPELRVADSPAVIITEIQTNGGTASQEFIELYNTTDQDIEFDDGATGAMQWKLQFFNSAAAKTGTPAWTTTATGSNSVTLKGVIAAHDYFLIASTDYLPGGVTPDMSYAPASSHLMTDTGGALQLLSFNPAANQNTEQDRVVWLAKSDNTALPQDVLATPAPGKSLQRMPNDDTEYASAEGDIAAFGTEDVISPLDAWRPPVVAIPDPGQTSEEDANGGGTDGNDDIPLNSLIPGNEGLAAPLITELLPNPASPLTDADDEFIELYNPNPVAFDLEGYKLEVGTTTVHTYIIPAGTLMAPLGYRAFYSAETGLSLSNTGGQARLRAPDGSVLNQTDAYTTADDNQAWTLDDGGWQWSTSSTPGQANILAVPVVAAKATKTSATKSTKTATASKTSSAKTSTAKPKTTKATAKKAAAKKPAKKKVTTAKTAAASFPEKPKPPIHMGILVAVATAAVLYGLYEYRHDISNKIRQLSRNRKAGLPDRLAPARR
jgi:hypothetical protein